MMRDLDKPFIAEEVTTTLFQMSLLKSITRIAFYQYHWDIVGPELCSNLVNCLNGTFSLAIVNHTYIVLIPKKKEVVKCIGFWPIV